MGRVLTDNIGFSYSVESSLGVAGTEWFYVEPNEIGAFGATIDTVKRSPISKNRQNLKGTVTDLDSEAGVTVDATISSFQDFAEAFVFSSAINNDVTDMYATTVVDTDVDSYSLSSTLTTAMSSKIEIDTLLWAEGFTNSGNNGLKSVVTDGAASDASIFVNESLTAEASPPSTARVSFCGHRMAAGDDPSWTWDGSKYATLSLSGIGTELQALGLTVGQFVHIGSIATASTTTVANAFSNSATDDMYGWARVYEFTDANTVVFDKTDAALQYTDATISTAVDILFGQFIRNVATDDSEYLTRSIQFELEEQNLGSGSTDMYSYSKGNYANTMSFNIPLADKATIEFGFIGTDTDDPVAAASRKTGASSASDPLRTEALSTSIDVARLSVADVDETGLSTDFKELTLVLGNNVSPEKVIGQLGAKYMNVGKFDVSIEAQLVFTNSDVPARIRANTTCSADFVLANGDGAIAVDLPSITLGGGDREFPENESVKMNVTAESFKDATFGTSIGISIIPVPIPVTTS